MKILHFCSFCGVQVRPETELECGNCGTKTENTIIGQFPDADAERFEKLFLEGQG